MKRLKRLITSIKSTENLLKDLLSDKNDTVQQALYHLQERGALKDGTLANLTFNAVNWDWATLAHSDLTACQFQDASLVGVYLQNTILVQADLSLANLSKINAREANMQSANITQANLSYANLAHTDFTNADLRVANLTEANLWQTNLSGANLDGADLRDATLNEVICNEQTRLPDGQFWQPDTDWSVFTG